MLRLLRFSSIKHNAALAATETAPQRAQRTQRFFPGLRQGRLCALCGLCGEKNLRGRDSFSGVIL
jgi:hypothetical protein